MGPVGKDVSRNRGLEDRGTFAGGCPRKERGEEGGGPEGGGRGGGVGRAGSSCGELARGGPHAVGRREAMLAEELSF